MPATSMPAENHARNEAPGRIQTLPLVGCSPADLELAQRSAQLIKERYEQARVQGQALCTFCPAVPRPGHRACDDPHCRVLLICWAQGERHLVAARIWAAGDIPWEIFLGESEACACGAKVRTIVGDAILPPHDTPQGRLCEAICACGQLAGRLGLCDDCLVGSLQPGLPALVAEVSGG